jgi:hypothetical protein
MTSTTDKVEMVPAQSGSIATPKKIGRVWAELSPTVLAAAVLAALALGGVLTAFAVHWHAQQVIVRQQKALQSSIDSVDAVGNPSKLKKDSDALIAGAKGGHYKVSAIELAQAYLHKGDIAYSAGDDQGAVADYAQAVALQQSIQLSVGNNEFLARYRLGERKTLIPLLQTLEKPYKNNHATGMQEQYSRYQGYIADLQAGRQLAI